MQSSPAEGDSPGQHILKAGGSVGSSLVQEISQNYPETRDDARSREGREAGTDTRQSEVWDDHREGKRASEMENKKEEKKDAKELSPEAIFGNQVNKQLSDLQRNSLQLLYQSPNKGNSTLCPKVSRRRFISEIKATIRGLPWWSRVKTSPSSAGFVGLIPNQGSKIPQASRAKKQTKNRNSIVKNSIKTLKMVHIKKLLKK